MVESRELRIEDFEAPVQPAEASVISRIRDSHHSVARLLAQGRREAEVSAITGYTVAYISTLKNDQAFGELLVFYREQVDTQFAGMNERMAQLGMDTVQELQLRLAEQPEKFSVTALTELMKTTADRTGNGVTKKHEHRVILNTEEIAKIKSRTNVVRLEDAQKSTGPAERIIDVDSELVPPREDEGFESERASV